MLHSIRALGRGLGLASLLGLVLVATGCSDSSSGGSGSSSNRSVRERLAGDGYQSVIDQGIAVKDELIALLADPDANMRAAAATALGRLKADGVSAIPAMLAAMQHADGRPQITYAIADMGSAAIPYLINSLGSADATVVRYATQILGTAGYGKNAAEAVQPLIVILESGADDEVKTHAVMALASIGSAADPALPAIEKVAAGATGTLKKQADGAIRRINDSHKPGQYTDSR